MIYGYARVSTAGQEKYGNSLESQEKVLRDNGAQVVYSEHYTGTKMDRPEFDKLLGVVKSGDKIIVTKLDRIARTASLGYQTIKDLIDKGVSVHLLNMGLVDNTPTGRLMLHIMLAFAEFERDMIVERTQEGKAVAKKKEGYREGRPAKYLQYAEAIANGATYEQLGISKATYYRYADKIKRGLYKTEHFAKAE